MKDLKIRVLSGIIGILLLFFLVNKGGLYLALSICLLSLIGLNEFYKAIKNMGHKPMENIGYIATLGIFLSSFFERISVAFILSAVMISMLTILVFKKSTKVIDIGLTLLSVLYIPFFLFHIYYLDGSKYIWLVFIIAFGTDTFAYLSGNLLGKRKLSPNISPNKTIEGSLGGIMGSVFCTTVYSIYYKLSPLWKLALLAVIASIFSQIGDLVASKIKRWAKIKDYGNIMPGHGGVLDRFDSIIFSSPIIYYYIKLFII